MKKIGLCLIVKNEAHVIERCLNSVKPLIDYVLICDTGSTDGTISVIESWLAKNKMPGKVDRHLWRNFAVNRSAALRAIKALNVVDYALMIDADEVLEITTDVKELKENLVDDWYDIRTVFPTNTYCRPQLTSTKKEFFYKGVVHEYLECDEDVSKCRKELHGIRNYPKQDSDRNRLGDKTRKDSFLLEEALKTEDDPFLRTRYCFYLAQSYKDCRELRKALKYYLMRLELGGWDQERYCAALEAAKIKEQLNYLGSDVIDSYFQAHEILPKRVEALYHITSYCRRTKRYNQGLMVGQAALKLTPDLSFLFMDSSIYDYRLMDEVALNAYWSGDFELSKKLCLELLNSGTLPKEQVDRIKKNLDEANKKL